jgi:hypothetical protein
MKQQTQSILCLAILFIHFTFVSTLPVPQGSKTENCSSCHAFNGFHSTNGNEELAKRQINHPNASEEPDGNEEILTKRSYLPNAADEPDRNVGATWFRRWWPQAEAGKRTDSAGLSLADDGDYGALNESGWNHVARKVKRGFITVDVARADGKDGEINGGKHKRAPTTVDQSPDEFYPSGSWKRWWKGQNVVTRNVDSAAVEPGAGSRKDKRGFITVDVAPADVDPGGGGGQPKQKRGFITVDVAPSDEHTDGHEWGRVRRGTEDGSGGAAPREGASAR